MVGEVKHTGFVDRDHGAFNLVGQATEIIEPLWHVLRLAIHFGFEFAVVAYFDVSQPFGVF